MSHIKDNITKILLVLPIIIMVTIINVFICFCASGVVFMQLITMGTNKYIALGAALLIAVGSHVYLSWNHKLRDFIKSKELK